MADLWAFIDESKSRDYLIVAALVPESRFTEIRKGLQALRMQGQRRIHFVDESNQNRQRILRYMQSLQLDVRVWVASGLHPVEARRALLGAVFQTLMQEGLNVFAIERDETVAAEDLKIFKSVRGNFPKSEPQRLLLPSSTQEPMLWISDAYAWAIQRGGDWTSRITVSLQTNA